MDELVVWLRAQIDKDEANADEVHVGRCSNGVAPYDASCECNGPDRVRAEAEAKRKILDEHRRYDDWLRARNPALWVDEVNPACKGCGANFDEEHRVPDINDCPTLRALALAYQHLPGYREEWRPD